MPRPPHSRRPAADSESGIVLVMSLLVMLILAVVVSQLFFSSSVDRQRSVNQVLELQMEKLAEAAILKAQVALVLDREEDSADSGEDQTKETEGGNAGVLGGGGGAGGGGGGPRVDSLDETWASQTLPFDLGVDSMLTTKILIEDEDSKINLLLLGTREEEYRQEWRDRMVRALDLLREGKPRDLSSSDAEDLVTRFESWLKGERPDRDLQTAPLASGTWGGNDGTQAFYPALSLAELCLVGGIDESLLYGFAYGEEDDREWVPGLTRIFTVWSNLELEEQEEAQPAGGLQGVQQPLGSDEEEDDPDKPEAPAAGVNNGRINVNTAPIQVLRALMPDEAVPSASWDEYEEMREERLKELSEDEGLFEDDRFQDPNDQAQEGEPEYPIQNVADLRNFAGFSESGYIEPDAMKLLQSVLTTESNVFTITVVVATQETPNRYYVARSVVWRRNGTDGVEIVPVIPFERLPPSAVDLSKIEKELAEWQGGW